MDLIWLAEDETGPGTERAYGQWLEMMDYTGFFAEGDWLLGQSTPIRWLRQFALDFAAGNAPQAEDGLTVNTALTALRVAEAEAVVARRDAIGVKSDLAGAAALGGLALASSLLLPDPIGPLATAGLGGSLALLAAADLDALKPGPICAVHLHLEPFETSCTQAYRSASHRQLGRIRGAARMATVSLESGGLRYISETRKVLERDGKFVTELAPGPAPGCQSLADRLAELAGEIAAAEARFTEGDLHGSTGDLKRLSLERDLVRKAMGACQASHLQALPVVVGLVTGRLASASIPTFFPPQLLACEHHVDRGVRTVLQSGIDVSVSRVQATPVATPAVRARRFTVSEESAAAPLDVVPCSRSRRLGVGRGGELGVCSFRRGCVPAVREACDLPLR
jgi:hypothetical protein